MGDLHALLTGLLRPLSDILQNRTTNVQRQADTRLEDYRQACVQLSQLLELSWDRLLTASRDWRAYAVSDESITLLDLYARDLTAWRANLGWLFKRNAGAMLEHVHSYGSLLLAVADHLRALPTAEHKSDLVSRLNVCEMKLELEMRAISRYLLPPRVRP